MHLINLGYATWSTLINPPLTLMHCDLIPYIIVQYFSNIRHDAIFSSTKYGAKWPDINHVTLYADSASAGQPSYQTWAKGTDARHDEKSPDPRYNVKPIKMQAMLMITQRVKWCDKTSQRKRTICRMARKAYTPLKKQNTLIYVCWGGFTSWQQLRS